MRIVAVGMKDLVVLEEAVADLVCCFAEYEAEPKSKMSAIEELALHLDIVSGGSNPCERFKLSFVGEGAKEKFKVIADGGSFEIPAGISKKDPGEFLLIGFRKFFSVVAGYGAVHALTVSDSSQITDAHKVQNKIFWPPARPRAISIDMRFTKIQISPNIIAWKKDLK